MIFRLLVGGGGSANTSLAGCATDDLRRVLTVSLTGTDGDFGEVGWYEELEEDFVDAVEGLDSATAGGGSSKDIWREEKCAPSLLRISVDEAGVNGFLGMAFYRVICRAGEMGRWVDRSVDGPVGRSEGR